MGRSTQRTRRDAANRATKTYKFSKFKEQAEKKRSTAPARVEVPPFVMDDIEPPIVITAPDTIERQLVIAETISRDGTFDLTQTLPLLRALCGDQFGRVWTLVRDDEDPEVLIPLVQAIFAHFEEVIPDAMEAQEDLPGGSGDSSN